MVLGRISSINCSAAIRASRNEIKMDNMICLCFGVASDHVFLVLKCHMKVNMSFVEYFAINSVRLNSVREQMGTPQKRLTKHAPDRNTYPKGMLSIILQSLSFSCYLHHQHDLCKKNIAVSIS